MQVIGNAEVRQQLSSYLPPVSLFVGPPSVGKFSLATEILAEHGAVVSIQKLDMAAAREFCRWAGIDGQDVGIAVRIDNADEEAINTILRLLEDMPPRLRVIFTASTMPPPTVSSRAMCYSFSRLTTEEVAEVLWTKKAQTERDATRLARRSYGSVAQALRVRSLDLAKSKVMALLDSVSRRDTDNFDSDLEGVERVHVELLKLWVVEVATRRWRNFTQADRMDFTSEEVASIWKALDMKARPKLLVRTALGSVLEDRRNNAW